MALFLQKTLRKREVQLSRISVYIVVIIVTCHTIRIVPNTWEIAQTFNGENQEVRTTTICHDVRWQILYLCNEKIARERLRIKVIF